VRTIIGDPVLADSLLFGALATLVESSTYKDFALAVLDAADVLVADGDLAQAKRDELETAFGERRLLECDRSIALDGGVQQTGIATNFQMLAYMISSYSGQQISCEEARDYNIPMIGGPAPPFPGNFQFSQEVPEDGASLSFRIEHEPDNGLYFWAYVRKSEMVRFDVQGSYFTFSVADEFDYEFGPLESGDETITIDLDSDPPLEPGATYYLALAQKNCTVNPHGATGMETTTRVSGSVEIATEPDAGVMIDADGPDEDAGTGADGGGSGAAGPSDRGCGCSQPGGRGGSLPFALLVALLFLTLWVRRSCLPGDADL
jgi:hypothetical protein